MGYSNKQTWVLWQLKALADENRLTLLTALADGERNVTQLAEILGVSEPTTSHHLTRLRVVGLVTLETRGNEHWYSIHQGGLQRFKTAMQAIETYAPQPFPESDDSWIEQLPESFTSEDRELLRKQTHSGRLKKLPSLRTRHHELHVVLRWLASQFQPGVDYTERQVNEVFKKVHDDFVSLRRYMVDFRYMERDRAGKAYRLAPAEPAAEDGSPSVSEE